MTVTLKGHADEIMMSLFLKEATYDAGVEMIAAKSCGMKGFEAEVDWPDAVANDKDAVTGYEHGSDQEITSQAVDISYKEARAKPNTLAGLAKLVMGACTSTKDGANDGYTHRITPVAVGTALPSMQVEHKKGGIQYAYKGVVGGSLKLSGEAGGYLALEASLKGSGTRATSATAFTAKISESWMKLSGMKVWLETGANIAIDATPSQAVEDISSATPDALSLRLKSFNFSYDNALEMQPGFGGSGVYQGADFGRRKIECSISLLFNDATELAYFTAQDACALEFDLIGALCDVDGTLRYGMSLQIPRAKIKKAPLPKGGVNDILTCDIDFDVQNDGTNSACILEVYNVQAAYLA
jgi:hypothetical protein